MLMLAAEKAAGARAQRSPLSGCLPWKMTLGYLGLAVGGPITGQAPQMPPEGIIAKENASLFVGQESGARWLYRMQLVRTELCITEDGHREG